MLQDILKVTEPKIDKHFKWNHLQPSQSLTFVFSVVSIFVRGLLSVQMQDVMIPWYMIQRRKSISGINRDCLLSAK